VNTGASLFNLIRSNSEELVFDRPLKNIETSTKKAGLAFAKRAAATATDRRRESF